jgi:DNA-directed RNA polymerase beta subunit
MGCLIGGGLPASPLPPSRPGTQARVAHGSATNWGAARFLQTLQCGSDSQAKRIRKVFGNIHEVVQMPNLIEVQRESYEQFLRSDPSIGYVSGLEKTLRSVFPIRDFAGTAELDFVNYELEPPSTTSTSAASAASPMPRRCALRCA